MKQNSRKRKNLLDKRKCFTAALAAGLLILVCLFTLSRFVSSLKEEEKSKVGKPLALFGMMCHNKNGFDFDGFSMLDSYTLFEKRLALTKGIEKPEIKIRTGEEGDTYTVVIFDEIHPEGYPGIMGSMEYCFYNNQFYEGELCLELPSYRAAKDYVRERMEAVSVYRDSEYQKRQEQDGITDGGWWTWETGLEGSTLEGLYVDRHHTFLKFYAGEDEEYKGHVRIQFGENINRYRTDWKKDSMLDTVEPEAVVSETMIVKNDQSEDISVIQDASSSTVTSPILDFETLCGYSSSIVKAKYVSRSELGQFEAIYVFEPEEAFTDIAEEEYIHLYVNNHMTFHKGESYYLFMDSQCFLFYPHVRYTLTCAVSEADLEREGVVFYGLGREELTDFSQYLREYVEKEAGILGRYTKMAYPAESLLETFMKSFEEAYEGADAIYRIKITETELVNQFTQSCEADLTEKIRARYKVGARMFRDACSGLLVPLDAALGEEFFLLEYYDKEQGDYRSAPGEYVICRTGSEAGQYIQAQIDSGREETSLAKGIEELDTQERDGKLRVVIMRPAHILINYVEAKGIEYSDSAGFMCPDADWYGGEYLEMEPTQYIWVIKMKYGYPEIYKELQAVLPEDGSWRIEETEVSYAKLEEIWDQAIEIYHNMHSTSSIRMRPEPGVYLELDVNYTNLLLAADAILPPELAPYIHIAGVSRVSHPIGPPGRKEKPLPVFRKWYDRICGTKQLHWQANWYRGYLE